MNEEFFKIPSFQSGLNEYLAEGLIKPYECVKGKNCGIQDGALRSVKNAKVRKTCTGEVRSIVPYYGVDKKELLLHVGTDLIKEDGTRVTGIHDKRLDYLNFEYNSKRIVVMTSTSEDTFMYDGDKTKMLLNRRKVYNDDGTIKEYIDADGKKHTNESTIKTLAPKGDFIELHYDRLWISGDATNPDRLYFSTASVNGADIEDFTSPIEEGEANQHGGFLEVRSYDGSKIIGMKVVFNAIVIFKNKTAYKLFGNSPDNYELVQLFSSEGAIADKSIIVANNGAYFLNRDGIYYYDGTNTKLISSKITSTIKSMNLNYADKSEGIYFNNKYYLSIPTGDSATNNTLIVYDIQSDSFMTYNTDAIKCFVDYDDKIVYAAGNDVKEMFEGNSYLDLMWQTPNVDFGKKHTRKMSNYLYFRGYGEGSVKFTLITEKRTKELIVPLTNKEVLYRKKLKGKGRMLAIRIENVNSSNINIIAPELLVELDAD